MLKHYLRWLSRKFVLLIFIGPLSVFIGTIWISPLMLNGLMAFTDMTIGFEFNFIGFKNFEKILFLDKRVIEVIEATAIYVGATILINAGFGLVLGIITGYSIRIEGISLFYRTAWMLPRMMPPVVYVLMWLWFTAPETGLFNQILATLGIPTPLSWLLQRPYSRMLMIMINGFVGASFGMIIHSAAVKSIPEELFRAAKVDGASDLQIIKHVIIPLLKWPILFVTAWQTLSLLTSYEYILITWGDVAPTAGTEVWSLFTYNVSFRMFQYGYAAALALLLVAAGISLVLLYVKVFGFKRLVNPSKIEV